MTTYTVTITPDDPAQAVTTVRLDLDGVTATVRELRLSPGSGGSLVPGDLPVLDLNQLVTAVLAATTGSTPAVAPVKPAPSTAAVPASAPGEPTTQAPAAVESVAAKPNARKRAVAKAAPATPGTAKTAPAKAAVVKTAKADAGKSAAPKAGAAKPAKASAAKAVRAKPSARSAAAAVRDKKASPAKATAKKAASSTPDSGRPSAGSRSYRKLPEDFEQVLRQAGDSASVIADHYDVPRHTAYGWIRTARKKAATA
ncbi:hypothetical protein AB0B66_13480 [Catellatospora sp. NPDC049111]|uniref:hypothetical protein n=1 Tax=Catellatospora sp. NPDC049111 TaxID=3155271 RepID=UPI0033F29E65